jgi:DNA-binding NarL/FixJ family response regulator
LPITLAIVEDQPILRANLRKIVLSQPDWSLLWEAGSLAQARAALAKQSEAATIAIVDIGLPDGSGLTLLPELTGPTRVLMYSVLGDEHNVIQALRTGAAGYLLKEASAAEIISAIQSLQTGGVPLTPSVAAHLLKTWGSSQSQLKASVDASKHDGTNSDESKRDGAQLSDALKRQDQTHGGLEQMLTAEPLTPRESEVLQALARGYSYAQAAQALGISTHTIGHHVKQIYGKLAVNSKSAAVFKAAQSGWL